MLRRLWDDDNGVVVSSELVLVSVLLVIGAIVGLTSFRDQIVQEFGDAAMAVGVLNQSYSFGAVTVCGFTVVGSEYEDLTDACEGPDNPGDPPGCIDVDVTPTGE